MAEIAEALELVLDINLVTFQEYYKAIEEPVESIISNQDKCSNQPRSFCSKF